METPNFYEKYYSVRFSGIFDVTKSKSEFGPILSELLEFYNAYEK